MRIGMRETRWRSNWMRMNSWKKSWNQEEWMEILCRQKSCKRCQSWWCMNVCPKKKSEGSGKKRVKNKPSSSLVEDTGEMIEWRSMSQEEMDQSWKKLAEKIEEEVLDRYKVGVWEDGTSPWRNTLHWAKAQRLFPSALLTLEMKWWAEYR